MNKKRIAQYCCAALVAAGLGLNIQNALSDYGIGANSLSLVAVGGSGSSSSSSGDGGYYPSGGPMEADETYVYSVNEECYNEEKGDYVSSSTETIYDNGVPVQKKVTDKYNAKYTSKNARITVKIKKNAAGFRPTTDQYLCETCSSLGLKKAPAPHKGYIYETHYEDL